jgi:hypothetical protein
MHNTERTANTFKEGHEIGLQDMQVKRVLAPRVNKEHLCYQCNLHESMDVL